MHFSELYKSSKKYGPALALERALSARARHAIVIVLGFLIIIAGILGFVVFPAYAHPAFGVMVLALAALVFLLQLSAYYNHYYFMGVSPRAGERYREDALPIELAEILVNTDESDITEPFLRSDAGRRIWGRAGLDESKVDRFLESRTGRCPASDFVIRAPVGLKSYAEIVLEKDRGLAEFLFGEGVEKASWIGAADWVERSIERRKTRERWWSRANMGKVPGIGKAWAYGPTYRLMRYSVPAEHMPEYASVSLRSDYHEDEVLRLEDILSRSREANALVIAEEGGGKRAVVARLARKISSRLVLAPLEHKRVVLFDGGALAAAFEKKSEFEREFSAVLEQAAKAGNILFVVTDLPSFMKSAKALGSDVVSRMAPFLRSSKLQIIAMSGPREYHESIAASPELRGALERVQVSEGDRRGVLLLLERRAEAVEESSGLYFTYPALAAVAEGAERYITDGVMPDAALDLLDELVPRAARRGRKLVTKQEVRELVTEKSGVPVAGIDEAEKDKLLNLETILHERIVGQDEAVDAVAGAMRRARSGITNPARPMASFLFLGPTGVGKTETAKTLAAAFFGDEGSMMRLDMSEYNAPGSVDKLIGSFEGGRSGTLAGMLREQAYGVLLLDEFEKAHGDVRDLFLQILDEGIFRDMQGREVNARNTIIIATSNAGSDLIWQYMHKGVELASAKDEIINTLVSDGVFRPELLNRFDGVVLYHPLEETHLRKVAEKMLSDLKARLRKKGVDLIVNEPLVNYLAGKGHDPRFGARALNRVIQNDIESIIADKLIRAGGTGGQRIELTKADLKQP